MMKRIFTNLVFAVATLGITTAFADDVDTNQQTMSQQPQSGVSQQPANQIQWYTNYNEALKVAKQNNKPVLLFFTGSDWCGWCKKMMQEIFSSPEFTQTLGNSFVFIEIDFPMNKKLAPEIAQQNNQLKQENGVTGYPTVIIKKYVNDNLTFVAETGYRPGGGKAYADYLNQLMQQ
jgi:protein disulfide-isomerase